MNSGNINVGKYSLDARKATKEDKQWVTKMANKVIGFHKDNYHKYYKFTNFKYIDCDHHIDCDNYPLITIQELKNKYYGNQIYELW